MKPRDYTMAALRVYCPSSIRQGGLQGSKSRVIVARSMCRWTGFKTEKQKSRASEKVALIAEVICEHTMDNKGLV